MEGITGYRYRSLCVFYSWSPPMTVVSSFNKYHRPAEFYLIIRAPDSIYLIPALLRLRTSLYLPVTLLLPPSFMTPSSLSHSPCFFILPLDHVSSICFILPYNKRPHSVLHDSPLRTPPSPCFLRLLSPPPSSFTLRQYTFIILTSVTLSPLCYQVLPCLKSPSH